MMDAGLEVTRLSHVYETEAVETFAQPLFLNQVAELRGTTLPPAETVMARLLRIEYALGRRREIDKGPRLIDLICLSIEPHKRNPIFDVASSATSCRRFVLEPLAELAPTVSASHS